MLCTFGIIIIFFLNSCRSIEASRNYPFSYDIPLKVLSNENNQSQNDINQQVFLKAGVTENSIYHPPTPHLDSDKKTFSD